MPSTSEYLFHPLVITRAPFYKFSTYDRPLATIIRDVHFATAISLSSKSLYQSLRKKDFSFERLSEKEKFSVKRYFNRMCFRPTPFGLSAGISVSRNGKKRDSRIPASDRVKTMIDFEHAVLMAKQVVDHQGEHALSYFLNPSLYKVNREYRYVKFVQKDDGKRTFSIESIELSDIVADVLSYFKQNRTFDEINRFLVNEYNITPEDGTAFSKELIERQVILSELMPNITGSDYCKRIMERLYIDSFEGRKKSTERIIFSMNPKSVDDFVNNFSEAENDVRALSGSKIYTKNPLYVNLEKSCSSGGISPELREQLLRGLSCLEKLVPDYQNERLIEFKKVFKRKFELKCVPLLTALDPEVGVGYCSLGKQVDECDLMGELQISNLPKNARSIQWSRQQTFLMNKWTTALRRDSGIPTIELREEDLHDLVQQENTNNLPPSMTLLFRKTGKSVYIEEAGGASALSIMGRFTAFNDSIKEAAEDLAEIEQSANPDIIFAEIAHLGNFKTANINRRAAIRQYEIPVCTGAGVDPEHQIALNDLWVSVIDDKIILRSNKLRKRIIPRLSSAYNFARSDLAVFRFLCDLQFQNVRSNFSLDLRNLFPDLSFYPRVQYKDVLLHLASWHLNEETINKVLAPTDLKSRLTELKALSSTLEWPQYISVNRHDNYITIDRSNEEELVFLLKLFKKNNSLIIKEFPFIDDSGCEKNEDNGYIAQHTALLYHEQKIYDPVNPQSNTFFLTKAVKRKFLTGSDWNYFKIYCHSARANELLIKHIVPVCERWMSAGFLDKWFFIRYADPEYHLRIRLHSHSMNTGMLIRGINTILTPFIESHLISNVQTGVYEREMERYGADIIEILESSFSSSTALIVRFLANHPGNIPVNSLFQLAYCSINIILDSFNYSLESRIDLLERFYQNLKFEFGISKGEKDRLKRKFRAMNTTNNFLPASHIVAKYKLKKEASYFQHTQNEIFRLMSHSSPERKDRLVGDVIHMHLNRLFASSPRKNELIVHYCLWKHYASEAARQRAMLSRLS